jgi:hypothetical protein
MFINAEAHGVDNPVNSAWGFAIYGRLDLAGALARVRLSPV